MKLTDVSRHVHCSDRPSTRWQQGLLAVACFACLWVPGAGYGEDIGVATATGIPEAVDGRFGKAVRFDGASSKLTVNEAVFQDEAGTFDFWLKVEPDTEIPEHNTIVRVEGTSPWTYHLLCLAPNGRLRYRVFTTDQSGTALSSQGAVNDGEWHHVVASYGGDLNQMELFVDGASAGVAPLPARTTGAGRPVYLGAYRTKDSEISNPLAFSIDEFRYFTDARSPREDASNRATPSDDAAISLSFD